MRAIRGMLYGFIFGAIGWVGIVSFAIWYFK